MLMKNISWIVGFLALTATSAAAQVVEIPERYGSTYHGHEMMWGDSQWGGFGMFLGPIFMILLVVGIVAAIIYVLRLFGGGIGPHANDRALTILKERFAKGEIDTEEFTARKKALAE
jgi:putative membrane protein